MAASSTSCTFTIQLVTRMMKPSVHDHLDTKSKWLKLHYTSQQEHTSLHNIHYSHLLEEKAAEEPALSCEMSNVDLLNVIKRLPCIRSVRPLFSSRFLTAFASRAFENLTTENFVRATKFEIYCHMYTYICLDNQNDLCKANSHREARSNCQSFFKKCQKGQESKPVWTFEFRAFSSLE